jgi:hypothetical protein
MPGWGSHIGLRWLTTKELRANGMPTFRPINKRKLLKLQ